MPAALKFSLLFLKSNCQVGGRGKDQIHKKNLAIYWYFVRFIIPLYLKWSVMIKTSSKVNSFIYDAKISLKNIPNHSKISTV